MRQRAGKRLGWILAVGVSAAPAITWARADSERVAFAIPAGPFKAAATTFALQAKVSIDLSAADACGASLGFVGRATADVVIQTLARDAGCAARRTGPRGYRVVPRTAQVTRPPPPASLPLGEPEMAPPPLSELVIVATRRLARADRLAYSISVLDERAMASRGVRDTTDLALTIPSMTVTNLGPGRDKVILRGLSDGPLTGQTQSMVGIYLDDVRLTYNAPDPDLLLVDVAQVEVLRGPQGALYGAGSLGGVLQVTARRPDTSRFDAWVSASTSATAGGERGGGASAMANIPLFNGRGAARVVGYLEHSGGYIDDPQRGLTNVNGTKRSGVRVSTTTTLGGGWDAEAGLVAQAIQTDDTQYAQRGVGTYARRNRLAEPHDNDFFQAHLGFKGALKGQEAKLTLAVVRHDIASRYDASAAPPIPMTAGAPVAFDDDNHVGAVMAEASVASSPEQRIQWRTGAFLARTRQGREGVLVLADARPTVLAQESRRDVLGEAALFGEAIGPLGGGWSLTLGGRLFATRSEASSRAVAGAGSSMFRGRQSYFGFAPKVVVSYAPNSGSLVYAQVSEGYRSGGFNTAILPSQVFDTIGGQPQRRYEGDELWNFELGAKSVLLDGRLRLRAAAFQARWKSIQSDQLLPSGLPYTANLGDGVNLGIEFEGGYVDNGFRLDASFLLNNPELETVNPAFPGRQDFGLSGVPKVAASIAGGYDGRLSAAWGWGVDLRAAYVGRSRLVLDAATAPTMGDYTSVRAALKAQSERVTVRLAADNIFGSKGDTFAYGNPFSLKLSPQSTPQQPRTVTLEFRVRY